MVVWLIDAVTNGVPVALATPPLAAAYQLSVPPSQPVAVRLTVPVPQREFGPATGADGIAFTVATTAVLGPSQPAALVHDT